MGVARSSAKSNENAAVYSDRFLQAQNPLPTNQGEAYVET